MAEGFELYHVPQQSRRDKLRVSVQDLHGCAGLLPLYDPLTSHLISPDFLTSATNHVKEEGMNLIGYVHGAPGISSSSSSSFMDPNNSTTTTTNNNPFLYTPQNLRLIDHHHQQQQQQFNISVSGGGDGELMVYKPETLALSLSSHNTHQRNHPLELNLQRYDQSSIYNGGGGEFRSTVPLGPFTGYASILKGSRFLKPAQELLEELCQVGCGINYGEKIICGGGDVGLLDPTPSLENCGFNVDDPYGCGGGAGEGRKKSRLISMLDEVYKKYKQYYQQMQAVVASFETVPGLGNTAPFANLALKAMSKHFRYLKNAITDQLQFTTKPTHGHINHGKEETTSGSSDRGFYGHRPVNNLGFADHQPVWRPQRGLPERAVTVLRSWLFDHFLHPYPTDTDKLMLAKQTGLSRNQVSNWFINARVRLWKPMVEEIHSLETRQVQKASQSEELQDADRMANDNLPPGNSLVTENPSTSTQVIQELSSKRSRNDFSSNNPIGTEEPMNLFYDSFPRHRLNIGGNPVGGSSGVSLTLGLHQNNGIGLSEPFPMSAAHRFGLDGSSEGFVMGGFEVQNRQFGRDIIGGQLLHDFVG